MILSQWLAISTRGNGLDPYVLDRCDKDML